MKSYFSRRLCSLLLALVMTLPLVVPAAAVDVISIDLSETSLTLTVGEGSQITATVQPDDADNKDVTWSTDNPTVATVDQGNVTAVAAGTATITATANDGSSVSAACTVTVKAAQPQPPTLTGITISGPSRVNIKEAITLRTQLTPADASVGNLTWDSSNSNIATVQAASANGTATVTGKSAGTVQIRASANGITSAPYTVTVTDPDAATRITLKTGGKELASSDSGNNLISQPLAAKETLEINATIDPSSAQSRNDIQWDTSNPDIATVDRLTTSFAARVTAGEKAGTAFISATIRGTDITARFAVTVSVPDPDRVKSIHFNTPAGQYIDVGQSLKLDYTISPSTALNQDVAWRSDTPAVATVSSTGVITGVAPGKATITATTADGGFTDEYEIEVSGIRLEKHTLSLYINTSETLTYQSYGNAKELTPTWTAVNPSIASTSSPSIGRVTGHFAGTTDITVTAGSYNDTCTVTVSEDIAQAITVNMGSSLSYSFAGILSQLNDRCMSKTSSRLDAVYNLTASPEEGILYHRYTSPSSPGQGVGGTERYYYSPANNNQRAIKDVSFVPSTGFDGTAVINYTGVGTNGVSFVGTIRIQASSGGDVRYSTAINEPVAFSAKQFADICLSRTGKNLRYVTFDLPSESRGILYYNYSPNQFSPKVDSTTRYYSGSNPSLDQITFVPAEGFKGNVDITYRCTDSSGGTYVGTVAINVYAPNGTQTGDVTYSTGLNQRVTLNASDFNSASQRLTNNSLSYIRFTNLPSSSAGRLYLNYVNSSSTQVTTGRNYYRSSTPRISNITFVPAKDYSGTVTIPFTGTNASGKNFNANLVIRVGTTEDVIHYNTRTGQSVTFYASDFNTACRAATGNTLDYVRFHLPNSTYGTLYYQYNTSSKTGSTVTTSTNYYYTSNSGGRLLSDVTFAAANTSGTVRFSYTGYSTGGQTFSGTVEVTVDPSSTATASAIRYTGSAAPVAFRSSDFQNVCQTALGNPLASVQFNSIPSTGRLKQNYSGPVQSGSAVTTTNRYSLQDLDRISYLPRAEYQGLVTIPFTVYDSKGASYAGSVEIQISTAYCPSSFYDTASGWDWAKPSIEFLRVSGITTGYNDGTFRPGRSISRGEFTLMLCRAFQLQGNGSTVSFPDVPASSVYASAIATARQLGIVQGSNGRFQPNSPITRQSAMTMICRAMEAAGQSVPTASTTLLSAYVDGNRVSSHARSAIASLLQMGAVRGTADMRLNPGNPISRAEMAVILHRVLTR